MTIGLRPLPTANQDDPIQPVPVCLMGVSNRRTAPTEFPSAAAEAKPDPKQCGYGGDRKPSRPGAQRPFQEWRSACVCGTVSGRRRCREDKPTSQTYIRNYNSVL